MVEARLTGVPAETTPSPKNTNEGIPADVIGTAEAKKYPNYNPPEKIISGATPDRVDDLFTKSNLPDNMQLEQPCCANEFKPCKHWVWDVSTGEGYRNSLSGRFMEVE